MQPPFENALVLTGPTASGKTQLGIELADRHRAEIVSMDSMAVYRRLDIGTAKPTPMQQARVPHHLVDVLEPWESANVWWWLDAAKRCVQEIEARGKQVLFIGGTPLYLKALLCGLFDGPPGDEAIRRRLTAEAQTLGSSTLHQRLAAVDPLSAERLHPNDVRRMVRALEVYELTGKPMSAWQTQWPGVRSQESGVRSQESGVRSQESGVRSQESGVRNHESGIRGQESGIRSQESLNSRLTPDSCLLTPVLWLDLQRDELYDRINRRVVEMFESGLLEEARQLRALDRPLSLEARQALGYKEVFDLLDGTVTLKEAIVRVQTRSRNFAKRQIAWFRHLPECQPATMELTRKLWMPRMKR